MKNLFSLILKGIYKLFIWSWVMLATVVLCVFVENGFNFNLEEKSENLGLYWLIGAFLYPAIRKFKGKSQKPIETSQKDDTHKKIELEKERQRLEREQKAFELKQKQEEEELLQKNNHTLVCEAIKTSNLSHQTFLDETQALKSDLNIVENKFFDLDNSLNEIKQRNEMLFEITGVDQLIAAKRKKLKSLHRALNSTQTLLKKD